MEYSLIENDTDQSPPFTREQIADFLHTHLDEFGDPKDDILKAIAYAMGDNPGQDGFIYLAHEKGRIYGAVIMNATNMSGYIPEYILVYIAVDREARGKGVGKSLMKGVIDHAEGDIALHVEPDNPARHLYTKIGFTNKYLEMRYKQ